MNLDFFDFFRWALSIVAGVYATIVTLQSLYGWYIFLNGTDKYVSILRRYVIVQGLRLRIKSFWGDVVICLLLCIVFIIIAYAHHIVTQMDRTVHPARAGNRGVSMLMENTMSKPLDTDRFAA